MDGPDRRCAGPLVCARTPARGSLRPRDRPPSAAPHGQHVARRVQRHVPRPVALSLGEVGSSKVHLLSVVRARRTPPPRANSSRELRQSAGRSSRGSGSARGDGSSSSRVTPRPGSRGASARGARPARPRSARTRRLPPGRALPCSKRTSTSSPGRGRAVAVRLRRDGRPDRSWWNARGRPIHERERGGDRPEGKRGHRDAEPGRTDWRTQRRTGKQIQDCER